MFGSDVWNRCLGSTREQLTVGSHLLLLFTGITCKSCTPQVAQVKGPTQEVRPLGLGWQPGLHCLPALAGLPWPARP